MAQPRGCQSCSGVQPVFPENRLALRQIASSGLRVERVSGVRHVVPCIRAVAVAIVASTVIRAPDAHMSPGVIVRPVAASRHAHPSVLAARVSAGGFATPACRILAESRHASAPAAKAVRWRRRLRRVATGLAWGRHHLPATMRQPDTAVISLRGPACGPAGCLFALAPGAGDIYRSL